MKKKFKEKRLYMPKTAKNMSKNPENSILRIKIIHILQKNENPQKLLKFANLKDTRIFQITVPINFLK